ncbi:MAG: hypothetical protein JOS17DRAFT_788121 [Linnemannia elongata]|nr:MAG: hypothetical protein JOS17DRAFT_788121 [Linnemannia elongata]
MENQPLPPPSSSSRENEADGGTISPIPATASQPNVSTPATKPSFADAVNKGINNKLTNKTAWNSIRSNTESRESNGKEKADPVWFTRHNHPYSIAIPFNVKTHCVADVVEAAVKSFPSAKRMDFLTCRGVVLLCFDTLEEKTAALGTTLECLPSPLPIIPTMFSLGTRIKIRAEYSPLQGGNGAKLAQDVFGSYGKIILVNQHYMHGSSIQSLSFDFVLEIAHPAPKNLLIPRVAIVNDINVLFTWSGSKFCFRCGDGSHTKIQCPKPLDFNLAGVAALEEPIMARAFPDPDAPLREPVKRNETPKTVPAAPKQTPNAGQEWSVAGQGRNKKRGRVASSGGGVTSASDSDSSKPPPRKQAPPNQESSRSSRPTPIAVQQTKTDLNATAVLPAIPITKADLAVAPATTEQATSPQKSADAVGASQLSSLGDAPEQRTVPQQQETIHQPEQQTGQQPAPQSSALETIMESSAPLEDEDDTMNEDADNAEGSSKDTDMSTKAGNAQTKAQARRDKQETARVLLKDRMEQIFDKKPRSVKKATIKPPPTKPVPAKSG